MCSVPGIGDIGNLLNLCHGGGFTGDLNNICQPSLPQPEPATGGIDAIVRPPATPGPQGKTLYDNYGVAGQFWAATDMQCSDMTSLIGNNVAGMVFDAAKAVDRVTITVYQSAAGNGILAWLSSVVDRLISSLGNAVYFPYLAPVILLGVMWLAWHGLIRKRATRTIEGTIWMVVACAAAIWLIGRPADFTGVGQAVSNGVTQVLNVAFSKLPNPGGGNCVPVHSGDPQSPGGANFGFTQGNGLVDQNANELWSVLVCKPWLDGEFGTTQFSTGRTGQTPVNAYGRQLLWSQAIAANEAPTAALIKAKQTVYSGIAASIKAHDPAIYPLFQGKQWTSRLEIGFAGLFAALVAGVLVLLIAITLIILKLGFLLLLIAGPFFLIVGTHPGFGRVVATRWFEMLVGVLLKSVAVAIVLSVLLYCVFADHGHQRLRAALGAEDPDDRAGHDRRIHLPQTLPAPVLRGRIRIDRRAGAGRARDLPVQGGAAPQRDRRRRGGGRRVRRIRRRPLGAPRCGAVHCPGRAHRARCRIRRPRCAEAGNGPTPNGSALADANGSPEGAEPGDGQAGDPGMRAGARGQGRAWAAADVDGAPSAAPPLHLPSRAAGGADDAQQGAAGWARRGVESAGVTRPLARTGEAPPRPAAPRTAPLAAGQARAASGAGSPPARTGAASGPPQQAGNGRGPAPRLPATAGPVARLGSAAGPAPWAGHGPGPAPGTGSAAGPPGRAGMAGGPVRSGGSGPGPAPGTGSAVGPPARVGMAGRPGAIGRRQRAGAIRAAGRPGWPGRSARPAGAGRGGAAVSRCGAAARAARCGAPDPVPGRPRRAPPASRGPGGARRPRRARAPRRGVAGLSGSPAPFVRGRRPGGEGARSTPASWSASASPPGPAPRSGPVSLSGPAPRSAPVSRSGPAPRSGPASAGLGAHGLVSRGSAGASQPRPQYQGGPPAYPATGPASGAGTAGPPQRSRGGGVWPGRAAPGPSRRGGAAGNGTAGNGTAGNGIAGNGAAGAPGAVPGGRDEAARREAPLPFWLRPVRRKK